MSFSSLVKDELSKKDFTANEKAFNIKSRGYRRQKAREFLRRSFMECGSMTDPNKDYHLEFVCETESQAAQIMRRLSLFDIDAKETPRGRCLVVYIKDSGQIADVLNIIGAHTQLMEFENVRILKEVRENVNRRVNCETANIGKTVSASLKQTEDIELIRDTVGLSSLDEGLREVAEARLGNPDATLSELAETLSTPIGKSGINHRLRKLGVIAEELRKERGISRKEE